MLLVKQTRANGYKPEAAKIHFLYNFRLFYLLLNNINFVKNFHTNEISVKIYINLFYFCYNNSIGHINNLCGLYC